MKALVYAVCVISVSLVASCKKPAEPARDAGMNTARVYFVSPSDGATVTSPVKVEMRVEGMKVQPAGELAEGTGHHHLIINSEAEPAGTVVPADATHIHFGKGQTETELKLKPGAYTLTLQFADGKHMSYGKTLSSTIHITVK